MRRFLRIGIATSILALAPPLAAHAQADIPVIHGPLSITRAIALGERNNPSIAGADADAIAGHARSDSASAALRPRVSANGFVTGGSEGAIYSSAPGVPPSTDYLSPSGGAGDGNLTVMFPVSTGGKLDLDLLGSRASAAAGDETAAATRRLVSRDIALAYDNVLLRNALVDAARSRVDAENEQVRVTQKEVDSGRVAPVDLLREQAEQADADQALTAARNDSALATVDLEIAMGVSLSSDFTVVDSLDSLYAAGLSVPDATDPAGRQAWSNRPEYRAAADAVHAASDAVGSARQAYAPQVYGVVMGDIDAADRESGAGGYTIGLAASLPIVDGGARRADIAAASARLARARADAVSVRQSIERDVAAAWLELRSAESRRSSAMVGLSAAQQAYDLATLRYNAGKSIDAERLDALSALTRARADVADATAAVLDARAKLAWAAGPGGDALNNDKNGR